MNEQQKIVKFKQLINALGEVFGKEVSTALIEIYWQVLKKYPISSLQKAVWDILSSKKFFPKPAEIIEAIEGTFETQVDKAWAEVLTAIEEQGAYSQPTFSDPRTNETIRILGGWQYICSLTLKELSWKYNEFKKVFLVISETNDVPALPHTQTQKIEPLINALKQQKRIPEK